MTDTYTLEQIRDAINACQKNMGQCGNYYAVNVDGFLAELTRPQHEFREGEVGVLEKDNGDLVFVRCLGQSDSPDTPGFSKLARPLRLSEMPKAVEDLRGTVQQAEFMAASEGYSWDDIHKVLIRGLNAFDEVIHD